MTSRFSCSFVSFANGDYKTVGLSCMLNDDAMSRRTFFFNEVRILIGDPIEGYCKCAVPAPEIILYG